ncbi:MAG: ATP-binding protein [Pseudomonadales bacterium]
MSKKTVQPSSLGLQPGGQNARGQVIRQIQITGRTLLLLSALLSASALAYGPPEQAKLEALIKTGLDFTKPAMDVRHEAIEEAREMLAQHPQAPELQRAEFRIADAYLLYQRGDVNGAIDALTTGMETLSATKNPNIYVRSYSLLGGLQLTAGDRQGGLLTLETLFKQDLSGADPNRLENARVNYASALVQNGRNQEASQAYEQALLFALTTDDDLLGLGAGSNYVSLLRDQGMTQQADYWLERLQPAMARTPNAMATAALELYEYGSMLASGETAAVITRLEAFLAQQRPMPSLVRSHGEELYSAALLAAGRLQESLAAAERALQLLDQYPVEQPESLMAIIRTLLAMEDYDAAGQRLEQLEKADVSRASNLVSLHQLRLEHALGTENNQAAAEAYQDFIASNNALLEFVNRQQRDYYSEQLDKQRTELELKLAREAQALLSAEAATQSAIASEAKTREQSLRQQRSLIIGFALLFVMAAAAFVYLNARRQLHSRLRQHLREQNASLSALVEVKSQNLIQKVTEQSKLEQALSERRHMEAIGQIAGHVAHDFNNLLQVISSTNELLSARAQTNVEKRSLAASNQSVRSGSSTVRQLLAYSRNQQLESRVFKVSTYLQDTHALFRSAVGDVNQLEIDDRTDAVWLKLDTGQLTASIINLLRNAAEAMDTPGLITLSASIRAKSATDTQASTSLLEPLLQLEVADQGHGMDSETLEHASRPYYTTKSDGTGLGLSSVYGFALQSGGQVRLSSEVGEGTRVALLFPLHDTPAETEPLPQQAPAALNGAHVLLVEDNTLIAQTLQAILEREGASSQWVSAGDEAQVVLASGAQFDLLLSDVKIPGPLDGAGLARWTRSNYPAITVGLMSGYGPTNEEDMEIPVLAKPFTAGELIQYLAQRRTSI